MTEHRSLGEILEEALRASSAFLPEPPPLVRWSEEESALQCMQATGWNFARQVALTYPADFADVWDYLCYVSDDMLRHLDTPEGWTVLADHVVSGLGITNHPLFIPTVQ